MALMALSIKSGPSPGGPVPNKPVELPSKAHGLAPPRSRLELPGHRSRRGQLCHQGHEDNLKQGL